MDKTYIWLSSIKSKSIRFLNTPTSLFEAILSGRDLSPFAPSQQQYIFYSYFLHSLKVMLAIYFKRKIYQKILKDYYDVEG